MKTHAYMNFGRWIADCPVCGTPNLLDERGATQMICGKCFPQIKAMAYKPKASNPQLFVTVPDEEERENARLRAKKSKQIHQVVYKQKPLEVEKRLHKRPLAFREWLPVESLKDLERENAEHGVPN